MQKYLKYLFFLLLLVMISILIEITFQKFPNSLKSVLNIFLVIKIASIVISKNENF